ncbi:MAG: VWA domain-containing protein, partial [Acidobacteriaceae bacterium]|nr:VWA domain-containing protein [Acidobacteriaceae bacterium]
QAVTADEQRSRKRVREPWSLVLQLLSLLLLLLAIAQLQLGTPDRRRRDHVLLLDTSSWTAQQSADGTLLDREKQIARQYLSSLTPHDRVMLVRVDALATPATSFTSDHAKILEALDDSSSAFSALNISQALGFAAQAQSWSGGQPGEIVYLGPARAGDNDVPTPPVPRLRVIKLPSTDENCGVRRIGVMRSDEDANAWQAIVTVKNYGSQPRRLRLRTQFAGTRFAPRLFTLKPGEETAAEYNFTTNTAGRLIAEIDPGDALPSDDRAVLELPRTGLLRVAVFTTRPEALKPLLAANHRLSVTFFPPSKYSINPSADVLLLDHFAPPTLPQIPSLWIEPPRESSPLPVKTIVNEAAIQAWHSETSVAAGLHAKEAHIPAAEVFQTFEGDIAIASLAEGPTVVARASNPSRPKLAVIGFDPLDGELKFEVTTPLLFANLLRWLAPEAFRAVDVTAGHVGAATLALDPNEHASGIQVSYDDGAAVPFTVGNQALQLFASRPGIIRVVSNDRERVLSLTLPEIAEFDWNPRAGTLSGLPASSHLGPNVTDLWQLLAVLGGLGLLIEWMLFGRRRVHATLLRPSPKSVIPNRAQSREERELVSK